MVKSILPLLAAAASAQDSTLEVTLDVDNAEVARGSDVMYSCSWALSADYGEFLLIGLFNLRAVRPMPGASFFG